MSDEKREAVVRMLLARWEVECAYIGKPEERWKEIGQNLLLIQRFLLAVLVLILGRIGYDVFQLMR